MLTSLFPPRPDHLSPIAQAEAAAHFPYALPHLHASPRCQN